MNDPRTMWLCITNIAMAVVVAVCFITVAWLVLAEVAVRVRRKWALWSELDRDMRRLVNGGHWVVPCPDDQASD